MKSFQFSVFLIAALLMALLPACGPTQQPPPTNEAPAQPAAEPAPATPEPAPVAQGPFLVENGASQYRLLLSTTASPSEKKAAEEIQAQFQKSTGAQLPIETGDAAGDKPAIVLGCGPAAKALGVDPTPESLGEQGYVLKTVAPHIVIAGTPMAGTLYGAYDFLERALEVRWFAPEVTREEPHPTVTLPAYDELVKPAFLWRDTSYAALDAGGESYTARQRGNRGGGGADNPYGIQYSFYGTCHSYHGFVSPGEFFESHPEYFSEVGGKRLGFETQLCLTNPDLLDIVTERMLKRMEERPELRQYNFSQEDYYNYCECAKCREINEKYKTMGGTQFWFVNQLAERTSKVYPDKLISTLAYMYTEEPPADMVMHPNVAVWLCHMYPCCDSHPISTCPLNADYKRRAEAWSKICSHLYMWHYIVDFAHYFNPFPNFRAMSADMRFYKSIGVEGIYLQGMGHGGGGGEFSLLRPYYGMKLLWNPDQDPQALIDEFLKGYYGAAADAIGRYITLIHDKVEKDNVHIHLYVNPAQGHFPDDILAKSDELFNEAEAAVAQDPELLERVKVARMPLTYARVFPRNGYQIEAGQPDTNGLRLDTLTFNQPLAKMAEVQEFIARMKQHGFKNIREWGGEPEQIGLWPMIFGNPMKLPVIENAHLAVTVVPVLGGRALMIVDKKSGQCVTAYNTTKNLFFPFCGGEDPRIGGMFAANMFGNMLPFGVEEHTPTSVSMKANGGGFDIVRKMTLSPDAPILTIETSVTNTKDKPLEARVRSHLDLDLGTIEQTRVAFTARSGETVDKDMTTILANLREGERFTDQRTPKSEWTLSGTKGLSLTQRFNPDTTEFTFIYGYPADLNDLEVEVQDKPVMVEPGQTHTFKLEYEIK
ncbi:MAG: DUF4838 domain-containing protein [Candidatus Hydrogenedentes bacterium]|nr:DUF4838 domain-containing protein [Candidatus Hydrogenedentota bacterium]